MPHFAFRIDEFVDEVFDCLERKQDGGAGHYARFTADTREEATERAKEVLGTLVDEKMYESDAYGSELEE